MSLTAPKTRIASRFDSSKPITTAGRDGGTQSPVTFLTITERRWVGGSVGHVYHTPVQRNVGGSVGSIQSF